MTKNSLQLKIQVEYNLDSNTQTNQPQGTTAPGIQSQVHRTYGIRLVPAQSNQAQA